MYVGFEIIQLFEINSTICLGDRRVLAYDEGTLRQWRVHRIGRVLGKCQYLNVKTVIWMRLFLLRETSM